MQILNTNFKSVLSSKKTFLLMITWCFVFGVFAEKFGSTSQKIVQSIQQTKIPSRILNICTYAGYNADTAGSHNFQPDIQNAIDSLSKLGGGTLLFSHSNGANAFVKNTEVFRVCGPITLKSNIRLEFHPNTVLQFECNASSYLPNNKPVLTRCEGTSILSYSPLIYAFNAQNIEIVASAGYGAMPVIDGDGESWQKWQQVGDANRLLHDKLKSTTSIHTSFNDTDLELNKRIATEANGYFVRPSMLQFVHCSTLKVEGIKLRNSPFWVIHPVFSDNAIFRNLMFDCQVSNNDGIDVDSSNRILIENIQFDNHDDNIALKSGRDTEGRKGVLVAGTDYENINSPYFKNGRLTASTYNVVVRNCSFKGHNALCVGSEISGGVRHIFVSNCQSPMEVMMGIFLKGSRKRGGEISDIYIKNLTFSNIRNDAICLIPNYDDDNTSLFPTRIKDVKIENIRVENCGKGVRIFGWKDALVENIQLKNINIFSVNSNKPEDKLLVNQVQNIKLCKVKIEGETISKKYSNIVNNELPPKVK